MFSVSKTSDPFPLYRLYERRMQFTATRNFRSSLPPYADAIFSPIKTCHDPWLTLVKFKAFHFQVLCQWWTSFPFPTVVCWKPVPEKMLLCSRAQVCIANCHFRNDIFTTTREKRGGGIEKTWQWMLHYITIMSRIILDLLPWLSLYGVTINLCNPAV